MRWQVQEAKQRFSEVLRRAQEDGPQIVTKHGEEIAVLIDINAYRHLTGGELSFKDFLRTMPELPDEVLERPEEYPREIDRSDD
ncbi:type II toxin-antitoxin system Phd/YefM family antitoxin [Tenggerimyces flavus]|uniref:Antitoxin n=1 Tax=Tenggerimyces flavus TaxID=1708749 RepID=A0ABV7YNC4_9ACTN|nr:type II toxin-antitoxin system Phd/YefM family antitoxin [Tenggerimyces flavus]MBM7785814.1 prevent-host-death family protein [Tenggerimyces flavus]